MYVEIELKKKKKEKIFDFESLVLQKFRKITAISHPCISQRNQKGGIYTRNKHNTRQSTWLLTAVFQDLLLHPRGKVVEVVAISHLVSWTIPRPEFSGTVKTTR